MPFIMSSYFGRRHKILAVPASEAEHLGWASCLWFMFDHHSCCGPLALFWRHPYWTFDGTKDSGSCSWVFLNHKSSEDCFFFFVALHHLTGCFFLVIQDLESFALLYIKAKAAQRSHQTSIKNKEPCKQ